MRTSVTSKSSWHVEPRKNKKKAITLSEPSQKSKTLYHSIDWRSESSRIFL
ncbi:hypothetical protein V6Z12_D07G058800 [Gossypium hirsutum]